MNIVDLIILALLGLAFYRGYNKGLMASIAGLVGHLAGLVTAYILSTPAARMLDRSFNLVKGFIPWFHEQLALPAAAKAVTISKIPFDQAEKLISDYDLPAIFKDIMLSYMDEVAQMPVTHGINTLGEAVAYLVGNFILTSIAFLLIFGITSLIIGKGIPRLLKKASPAPVTLFDRFAGAGLRMTGAAVSIAVTFGVVMPVFSIGLLKERGSILSAFAVLIQNSKIANIFTQAVIQVIS
jgi:hypothetical protein